MKDELIEDIAYLKRSTHRIAVLSTLSTDKLKRPSDISKEKNMSLSDVSRALKGLKDNGFVECLNEKAKQGRLYQITKKGKKSLEYL